MDSSTQALLADVDRSTSELVGVLRRCSRRSLEWFRRPVEVQNKLAPASSDSTASTDFDPVTKADRLVEDLLREFLTERFPTVGIYGEERGESGPQNVRWIIDPIDGTRAFVTGRPMWGTLLGLEVESVPMAGFMHIPTLDESYWAVSIRDSSGSMNNSRARFWSPLMEKDLSTSGITHIAEASLASTHPTMFVTDKENERFSAVASQCRLVRYDGDCYNYGLLASGDIDIVIENQLQPYDIAPLIPMIEAAGGIITGLDGGSARSGGFVVASANEELHAQVLGLMSS